MLVEEAIGFLWVLGHFIEADVHYVVVLVVGAVHHVNFVGIVDPQVRCCVEDFIYLPEGLLGGKGGGKKSSDC